MDYLTLVEDALKAGAEQLTADRPDSEESWEEILARLTAAAAGLVPGADYAGLTMRAESGGRHGGRATLVSRAPSHEAIAALDQAQAELGEGPCIDALAAGGFTVLRVDDYTAEPRWPRFATLAGRAGIASSLSYAMAAPGEAPGAINFYATTPGAFADPTARTVAAAFATQAAIAVYGRNRVHHLTVALATRDLIGRAKGILMERFTLHDDEAFTLLVRSSQDTNLKLADVAAWVNDEATRRADARAGGSRTDGKPPATGATPGPGGG